MRPSDVGLLVVPGGDGSVHHAIGFCAETGAELGVVPGGCGNGFARALGIPADPSRAARALAGAPHDGGGQGSAAPGFRCRPDACRTRVISPPHRMRGQARV
ncbi:diacylglycerol/lipid kinase family protein [Amycolatopsis sp.]|uniref:diacylglycerol/lipid kinase family protein n=1 Tax=Amycolatopsis sp. TaxID=37632 RepID=UPI0039C87299